MLHLSSAELLSKCNTSVCIYPMAENVHKKVKQKKNNQNKSREHQITNFKENWKVQKQVLDIFMNVCVRESNIYNTLYRNVQSIQQIWAHDHCVYKSGVEIQSYTICFVYVYACVSACVVFRNLLRWRYRRRPLLPPARPPPPHPRPHPPLSLCFSSA